MNPSPRLERISLDDVPWDALDRFPDRCVSQSREWVEFVAATQRAEPVVAELRAGGEVQGYFTGLVVRKLGAAILGSPFPGWTTPYMGFNLHEGVSRRAALGALLPFAFETLGCVHLELKDRYLRVEDGTVHGLEASVYNTFEIDLRRSEDELWSRFTSACRRAIRKSENVGVVVEEAADEAFALDYYEQLKDVFAKQSRVPTYGLERVRSLVRHLGPTGRLLLLRARTPDGTCIATGIFPAMNRTAFFWGGASLREHQILRPNEPIFWYAMRYWKERGVEILDTGGGGDYKRKYGVEALTVPFFRRSRSRGVRAFRTWSEGALRLRRGLAARLSGAG